MNTYIGTKIIVAEPRAKEDEDGNLEQGYKVVYEDGYTSWSPKNVFEKAYRLTTGMPFGLAIEAMKRGEKVCRTGWNGKGMYLWLLPAAEVKKEWVKDPMLLEVFGERDTLTCSGSIRMKTADGSVLTGWLASQTDILADDWIIV